MWPFKIKPVEVPCCADAARIQIALDLIDDALEIQRQMWPEDRNGELEDLAMDVLGALTPTHVTGRP